MTLLKNLSDLKFYHNRFFLLLLVLVTVLPFSSFFTSLFILFIGVNFFTHAFWKTPISLWAQPWLLPFLFFFIIQLLGLYLTPDEYKVIAQKKIETKLPFIIVPLFFATGLQQLKKTQIFFLLKAFSLSVIAMALFCLGFAAYNVISSGSWHSTWSDGSLKYYHFLYSGLSEVLMHPGYMSVFVGFGIFTSLYWLRMAEKQLSKNTLLFAIAFLVVFLIMLQGRINILAFLFVGGIALFFYLLQSKTLSIKIVLIALGFLTLGAFLFQQAPEKMKQRFTGLADFSYDLQAPTIHEFTGITIRLAEWECVRVAIAKYGFWGTGQGASQAALRQAYAEKNFVVGLEKDLNAHNQLYETRLANGWPGLVVLLLIFIVLQWHGWAKKNYLLVIISAFYFISFLSESMFERYFGVIIFCVVMPIIAQLPSQNKKTLG